MKTITLVAYNRLHYMVRMIESLKRNNLEGYTLFIGVEPDNLSVVEYCQNLNFMPTKVTVNPQRLGVAWNPFATISRAFDSGSDFNVAVEDDLILSPDALDLANWFFALPENPYLCLGLFNYESDPTFPDQVEMVDEFTPLGWAITASIWRRLIKSNWMIDSRGWDFSMNIIRQNNPANKVLRPQWARANHIGREGGVHCSPEFHDQMFSRLEISDGSGRLYHLKSQNEGK